MTPQALLDVAMIVKSEEAYLPACLASLEQLRPILGVVHIYDTGSSDRTVEIARTWGAKVTEGYWDDDFARARNASLTYGSAPWILWTDADDVVQANVRALGARLRDELRGPVQAFSSLVVVDGHGGTLTAHSIRVMRRGSTCFENRVHERVVLSSGGLASCAQLSPDVLTTVHTGYTAEAHAGKVARNLALLEGELQEARRHGGPHLTEVLWNRARTLMGANRFEEAIDDLVEARRHVGGLRVFRLEAGELLAMLYLETSRYDDAEVVLQELRQEGQDPEMTAWLWGKLALGKGEPREALTLLRLINRPKSGAGRLDSWVPVLAARAQAAALAGEYDESLAAALPLLAKHGAGGGLGQLILAMWGSRPDESLAMLLAEFGSAHAAAVGDELCQAGARGEHVNLLYRERLSMASGCAVVAS